MNILKIIEECGKDFQVLVRFFSIHHCLLEAVRISELGFYQLKQFHSVFETLFELFSDAIQTVYRGFLTIL